MRMCGPQLKTSESFWNIPLFSDQLASESTVSDIDSLVFITCVWRWAWSQQRQGPSNLTYTKTSESCKCNHSGSFRSTWLQVELNPVGSETAGEGPDFTREPVWNPRTVIIIWDGSYDSRHQSLASGWPDEFEDWFVFDWAGPGRANRGPIANLAQLVTWCPRGSS